MKTESGAWSTIYSGANRFWTDSNYVYDFNSDFSIKFRVRVCDIQNKCSMWSNVYETKKNILSLDINYLSEFKLYQNYPNPLNPSTTIKYSIPKSSQVSLKIFNTLGEELETLVNEEKTAGMYNVQFTINNLASGVYFYRLQAGSFVESRKMILLK